MASKKEKRAGVSRLADAVVWRQDVGITRVRAATGFVSRVGLPVVEVVVFRHSDSATKKSTWGFSISECDGLRMDSRINRYRTKDDAVAAAVFFAKCFLDHLEQSGFSE